MGRFFEDGFEFWFFNIGIYLMVFGICDLKFGISHLVIGIWNLKI